MMQQYHQIKREVPPDALLLFRLGDFYEMFFDDAKEAARILDVALTQRHGVPMCGVPYHSLDPYLQKLIRAGKRVALCDQLEAPRPGQVVKRGIVQIVSPGSVIDGSLLDARRNNYCASLFHDKRRGGWAMAYLDLSTGEFRVGELASAAEVADAFGRVQPAEWIVPGQQRDRAPAGLPGICVACDDWAFRPESAEHALLTHFKTHSLDGFGLGDAAPAVCAAGGLLHYLATELRRDVSHVRALATFGNDDVLGLDAVTRANLELVQNARGGGEHTLLAAVDRTVTSGGARLLRQWILNPLCDRAAIQNRQDVVGFWVQNERAREAIRSDLREVRDLERLIARLSQGSGNARDLAALRGSLDKLPSLLESLRPDASGAGWNGSVEMEGVPSLALLAGLRAQITPMPELVDHLSRALADEPPLAVKDGGLIRDGFHGTLDELRAASTQGKEWLAQLQAREIERTGIKSLKVRFNQVFGYYIEISRSNLGHVPSDYTRKQTMANGERFITPELKDMESKILGAEERGRALEYEIFIELRQAAVARMAEIQATARAVAAVDILIGWAALAQEHDYCRPEIESGSVFHIEDGRHPILEQMIQAERFVPNDAAFDSGFRLILLTGPNMAGKSTYIRQVALIAILAHCGCFVPARSARIGILDRVFTRVGANDDLSRGQSTFMVEMNETANILNHATSRSLVVLDEIGRGTSTFDGLSIAWAVAEYLHDVIRCKGLFATHYHELTELAMSRPGVRNFNVAVREWGDQVVFLRKIVPGGADKSYGIQVARLAGLPAAVLSRAKEILRQLEEDELDESGNPKLGRTRAKPRAKGKAKGSGKKRAGPGPGNGHKHLAQNLDLFTAARPQSK